MAREWGLAPTGGLKDLVDQYAKNRAAGQNMAIQKSEHELKKDSAYNDRAIEQNKLGGITPIESPNGNIRGFKRNEDERLADMQQAERMRPGLFENEQKTPTFKPPVSPQQARVDAAKKQSSWERSEAEASNQTSNQTINGPQADTGDPKPLLKDHKGQIDIAKQISQNQKSEADIMSEVEKNQASPEQLKADSQRNLETIAKKLPPGVDKAIVAPANDKYEFGDGNITGKVSKEGPASAAPPAQPPTQAAQEPVVQKNYPQISDRFLREITQNASTATKDRMIPVDSLPDKWKQQLGIDEDFHGSIPASMLNDALKNSMGQANPLIYDIAEKVKKGEMGLDEAAFQLKAVSQRAPNQREWSILKYADAQRNTNANVSTKRGQDERKYYANIIGDGRKELMHEFRPAIDQLQAARNMKLLASRGDTNGLRRAIQTVTARASGEKGALSNQDISGFGGLDGWTDRAEQIFQTVTTGGLTENNKQLVNSLADDFINSGTRALKAKSSFIKRGVLAQVGAYGLDPSQAASLFDEELSADRLLGEMDMGNESQSTPAGKGEATSAPKKGFKPTSQETALREEMRLATEALNTINADKKLNGSQKRQKSQKIREKFKKITGIDY